MRDYDGIVEIINNCELGDTMWCEEHKDCSHCGCLRHIYIYI